MNLHTIDELNKLRSLSLDEKIHITEARILEFYHGCQGQIYISFSGGKDSTVLLHLVRTILPSIEAVFCDTGLEFPEIRDHVKSFENVRWLKPEKNFRQVIEEYGYPVISKEVADTIYYAKKNPNSRRATHNLSGAYKGVSRYDMSKYAYLLDAPFEVNAKCCDIFKKAPFKKYEKETHKSPMIGSLAEESFLRMRLWMKNGCNVFNEGKNKSMPLSFWTENDIYEYIERFQLKLAKVYDMGYKRTGCVFCAFGSHRDKYPNRFQLLQRTHPKLHEYILKDFDKGGLGMKIPLEFIGVEYSDPQLSIYDLMEELDNGKT